MIDFHLVCRIPILKLNLTGKDVFLLTLLTLTETN